MGYLRLQFAGWLIGAVAITATTGAQEAVSWKTGPDFQKQLNLPASLVWPDNPLRASLARFARQQQTAVFLDRRIDPDQHLELTIPVVKKTPLKEVFREIAEDAGGGVCAIGDVVYIGPVDASVRLPEIHLARRKEAASLPPAARSRFAARSPTRWDDLATPRAIVESIARQAGLTIENPDAIPHDLWAGGSLPSATLVDRLTLLLAGFNLTYQHAAGGDAIRLVPIETSDQIERTYELPGDAQTVIAQAKRLFPNAEFRAVGKRLTVIGSLDAHRTIASLLREQVAAANPRPNPNQQTVYTLAAENKPVGGIIKAIAENLGKKLVYSPACGPRISRRVTFSVKNVRLEDLLQATLTPAGLDYELTETELRIKVK